jgi:hypothetical protein
MKHYEYIRLAFDFGDLAQLNRFSGDGWRVVAIVRSVALLERELPGAAQADRTKGE